MSGSKAQVYWHLPKAIRVPVNSEPTRDSPIDSRFHGFDVPLDACKEIMHGRGVIGVAHMKECNQEHNTADKRHHDVRRLKVGASS